MATKKQTKINILLKLLPSVVAMVLILSILVAYAWFYHGDIAGSMTFSLGTVNSEIWFFKAVDNNFNGIPELNTEPDTSPTNYVYTSSAANPESASNNKKLTLNYREQYLFNVDSIKTSSSTDSALNTFELSLSEVYPSQVYTSKISIVNRSNINSSVSLSMRDGQYDFDTAFKIAVFAVRIGTVDESGNVSFGQYTYLCDCIENNTFSQNIPFVSSLMKGVNSESLNETPSLEHWIQIKMLPFDDVKDKLASKFLETNNTETSSDVNSSKSNELFDKYNSLQGSEITLPDLYIYFDVDNENN